MADRPPIAAASPGRRLGAGKRAEVFEYGDGVIKLYKPGEPRDAADREAAILAFVAGLDLPIPTARGVIEIGSRWGLVLDRAPGPPWAEAMLADGPAADYLSAMAALHARIHAHAAKPLLGLKEKLAANLIRVPELGEAHKRRLREMLGALPDGDRLCHGDFHPFNILGPIDRPMVIDWLDATRGNPAADVCRTYVLLRPHVPELAAAYVAAYAHQTGTPQATIFAWRPVIAAARLAEGVPDESEALLEMAKDC